MREGEKESGGGECERDGKEGGGKRKKRRQGGEKLKRDGGMEGRGNERQTGRQTGTSEVSGERQRDGKMEETREEKEEVGEAEVGRGGWQWRGGVCSADPATPS
jgi:hypothetical protein